MAEDLPAPKSRKEEYLATAAGMTGVELPEPASREEIYLDAIAQGGGGGTSYTAGDGIDITNNEISVDTETIQPKLTAGTNITIDADNVISAQGGGVKELTSADYDYPANNPDGVAAWNLDVGMYHWAQGVKVYIATSYTVAAAKTLIVGRTTTLDGSNYKEALMFNPLSSNNQNMGSFSMIKLFENGSSYALNTVLGNGSIVQTAGTSTTEVISQYGAGNMVFGDPSNQRKIRIGNGASSLNNSAIGIGTNSEGTMVRSIALGTNSHSTANDAIAIGSATAAYRGSIAVGAGSSTSAQGEINVGSSLTDYGYDNSNYRLLTGLYDPQNAHDAATKGYVDTKLGSLTLVSLTQSAYDALTTKDPNTLYIITGA